MTFVAVIQHTVSAWHPGVVDPDRIGAFGFSAGGLTVLLAAGGVPDLARIAPYCRAQPHTAVCVMIATSGGGAALVPPAGGFAHGRAIRAVSLAAPALGFAFTRVGLAAVTVPVQLWRAGDDTVLPAPTAADAVRDALPHPAEFHLVPGARHVDFADSCVACAASPVFDRAAFHLAFDRAVAAFFRRALAAR